MTASPGLPRAGVDRRYSGMELTFVCEEALNILFLLCLLTRPSRGPRLTLFPDMLSRLHSTIAIGSALSHSTAQRLCSWTQVIPRRKAPPLALYRSQVKIQTLQFSIGGELVFYPFASLCLFFYSLFLFFPSVLLVILSFCSSLL